MTEPCTLRERALEDTDCPPGRLSACTGPAGRNKGSSMCESHTLCLSNPHTHTHTVQCHVRISSVARCPFGRRRGFIYFVYLLLCIPPLVYALHLTSSPVTDSTLRLFFILIGSFWAPGRSVPEPRQQSRWRARTGEVKGHREGQTGVRPGQNRPPIGADSARPTASPSCTPSLFRRTKPGGVLPLNSDGAFISLRDSRVTLVHPLS